MKISDIDKVLPLKDKTWADFTEEINSEELYLLDVQNGNSFEFKESSESSLKCENSEEIELYIIEHEKAIESSPKKNSIDVDCKEGKICDLIVCSKDIFFFIELSYLGADSLKDKSDKALCQLKSSIERFNNFKFTQEEKKGILAYRLRFVTDHTRKKNISPFQKTCSSFYVYPQGFNGFTMVRICYPSSLEI